MPERLSIHPVTPQQRLIDRAAGILASGVLALCPTDAGITSSSWARGPFHEWGPNWVRGPGKVPFAEMAAGEKPLMQFPSEFDWIAPSGRAPLTCFLANHYPSGRWVGAAPTPREGTPPATRHHTVPRPPVQALAFPPPIQPSAWLSTQPTTGALRRAPTNVAPRS